MKIRFGVGIGRQSLASDELVALGQNIASIGFDSIWLSEVLLGMGFDPLVGLSYLAAAVPKLKLGTTMLLPGRNPLRLAKALASLDRLSNGKLFVTFVPGLSEGAERTAVGVEPRSRGAAIEELLPIVRALVSGEQVHYESAAGTVEATMIEPRPVQQPLEFWLGGLAPKSLDRCGRLADGWLPSLCEPEQARTGKDLVETAASSVGRRIDPEHFGISLQYARFPLTDDQRQSLSRRARQDVSSLIPIGRDGLRRTVDQFVKIGFSKFVLRPVESPHDWRSELDQLASDIIDLQT